MIEQQWFIAMDGRPIHNRVRVPADPRGVVLLLHGYAGHGGRYTHVIEHLAARGLAVFCPDHRGHGRTGPHLGDLGPLATVLGDLAVLHRDASTRLPSLPVFVLGHSMGGMLGCLYAQRTPGLAGAVLNGAALDIPDDISRATRVAARVLERVAPRLEVEPFYDPASLADDPDVVRAIEADPLFYKGRMQARTGAQLLRGVRAAVRGLPDLRLPLLVTHGTLDRTVPPRASEVLYGGAASEDKQLHWFDGLLHEVHNCTAREQVLATWSAWVLERC